MITGEPMRLGVKATEQVPPLLSVQLAGAANVPAPFGFTLQVTVPEGVPTVPTGLVSVTVAVHVVATPRSVGFGEHTTAVAVVR